MSNCLVADIHHFLKEKLLLDHPVLIGLSGGPDSLALFHVLLAEKRNFPVHIVHIDHGLRLESTKEAEELKALACKEKLPFHSVRLTSQPSSNIEEWARQERLRFFKKIYQEVGAQALLLGHQSDEQLETVLKRLFEGAHAKHYSGMQKECEIDGMRIIRPCLSIPKEELWNWLKAHQHTPFDDASNRNCQFLRARMREEIIPLLERKFQKNLRKNLSYFSETMSEINSYFSDKIISYLAHLKEGRLGVSLDLNSCLPLKRIELRYLLKEFCQRSQIELSREQYNLAIDALEKNRANICLIKGSFYIDRGLLFVLKAPLQDFPDEVKLESQVIRQGPWEWKVLLQDSEIKEDRENTPSYLDGSFKISLAEGDYLLKNGRGDKRLKKLRENYKTPAFLRRFFPVIYQDQKCVWDFLSSNDHCSTAVKWSISLKISFVGN